MHSAHWHDPSCIRLVRWFLSDIHVENGTANPSLNALEVIANALGLTVFELFERVRLHKVERKSRK
jgi:transcriptional regulator with XRE-family HTH domain